MVVLTASAVKTLTTCGMHMANMKSLHLPGIVSSRRMLAPKLNTIELCYIVNAAGVTQPHLDPQGNLHELLQLHHQLRQAAAVISCLWYVIIKSLDYWVQGYQILLSL